MIFNGLSLVALLGALYFSYLCVIPHETWWSRAFNRIGRNQ